MEFYLRGLPSHAGRGVTAARPRTARLKWAAGKVKPIPNTPPSAALAHAIAILSTEIARPILPYPDLTRPCPEPEPASASWYDRESKPLHAELRAFMADPAAASRTFARRQAERHMIENWIRNHRLDLDTHTTRKSSPHQLHCTKNSASRQRALTMREADIMLLRKLEAV